MAKKIIIDYSSQPLTNNTGFNYTITINGFDLVYNTAETECNIEYIPRLDIPANINELGVGLTLEQTIQLTLDYLRTVFVSDVVFYSIVNNTIEVFINADAVVTVNASPNANITLDIQDVDPSGLNLIYYMTFDDYRLNIYKENYNGGASEINGNITITKSAVDNVLDSIRGTGLQLSLEANPQLTFDEFALSDEFTFKTELLQNGFIIYEGYIKPDGTQQSYVNDEWLINIESTDGLGALKDLSFVKSDGTFYTGKLSFYEIIEACLNRTRLTLDINTSINIEYNGYTGNNILKDVYVNTERFIKDSNDNVLMDCNEVLTSVLNLFSGVITQQDGKWWIYRPNDLQATGYTQFINQTTNETFLVNLNKTLGSQINNFYPHHAEANQQIETKGAISAYRLNYKYGFVNGLLENPNLNHDEDYIFNGWTVNPSLPSGIIIEDSDLSGVKMKPNEATFPFTPTEVIQSDSISTLADTQLTLNFKVATQWLRQSFYFKVVTSDGYYLNTRYEWELGEDNNTFVRLRCGKNFNRQVFYANLELLTAPVPNDCTVSIIICRPTHSGSGLVTGIGEVQYAQISDTTLQRQGIVGENHTVSRSLPPSSITKENQQVFNGDGDQDLIGSIYKEDLESFTDLWNRVGKTESLPILGISAMDDLRIQSSPIKIFSGGVYGYLPYLSVITIDNIVGSFMFTEWNYDLRSKKSTVKLTQFYNADLADILYEVTPDYGNNTIKPTIVG